MADQKQIPCIAKEVLGFRPRVGYLGRLEGLHEQKMEGELEGVY